MAPTTVDPITLISVFLSAVDNKISFSSTGEEELVRRRPENAPALSVLNEGEGFRVYVFDDRHRMRGFLDAMPVLTETSQKVSWAWGMDLEGGLSAVAVRFPEDSQEEWHDLRGDKTYGG